MGDVDVRSTSLLSLGDIASDGVLNVLFSTRLHTDLLQEHFCCIAKVWILISFGCGYLFLEQFFAARRIGFSFNSFDRLNKFALSTKLLLDKILEGLIGINENFFSLPQRLQ